MASKIAAPECVLLQSSPSDMLAIFRQLARAPCGQFPPSHPIPAFCPLRPNLRNLPAITLHAISRGASNFFWTVLRHALTLCFADSQREDDDAKRSLLEALRLRHEYATHPGIHLEICRAHACMSPSPL